MCVSESSSFHQLNAYASQSHNNGSMIYFSFPRSVNVPVRVSPVNSSSSDNNYNSNNYNYNYNDNNDYNNNFKKFATKRLDIKTCVYKLYFQTRAEHSQSPVLCRLADYLYRFECIQPAGRDRLQKQTQSLLNV